MIPAYTSMADHIAAFGLSHDTSLVLDMMYIAGSRRMERMQVNPPRQNSIMRTSFCRFGKGNALSGAMGSMVVHMSVKMLRPAIEYLVPVSAEHCMYIPSVLIDDMLTPLLIGSDMFHCSVVTKMH